jgi:hypothetical protein
MRAGAVPMILWGMLLGASGCSTSPTFAPAFAARPASTPAPAEPPTVSFEPPIAIAPEPAPPALVATPPPALVATLPVDPGAQRLVAQLARAIGGDGLHDRPTTVSLAAIRNQSHVSTAEFARFRQRLAGLLDRAGYDANLAILPSGKGDYVLGGAAYLVTQRGYDRWELYLVLRHGLERARPIWRADDPVRLLRLPGANGSRVMLID